MTAAVLFNQISTSNGKFIGHARLNKPKALNALDIGMIRQLSAQLQLWQSDPDVALVMLDGEGDKVFCAGGDVVAMHQAMISQPGAIPQALQTFFTEEYRLDHLIHTFAKPVVVWGNGIVMGGGLGLMNGASQRIVTESSRIAMPEITIGLYPDVGASWFLPRMPGGAGLFLGLTGASINAADALHVNLADHFIPHGQKAAFIEQLVAESWRGQNSSDQQQLASISRQFNNRYIEQLPKGQVEVHQAVIDKATAQPSVVAVVESILALDTSADTWLSRAQSSLAGGSPVTMHLVFEQLRRSRGLSLAECFQMELIMSCRCGQFGEFKEGVRARLIDKDNQPKWRFAGVKEVPPELVASFFQSPWPTHPLIGLEETTR